ncbi:hypothetical protein N0V85_008544 [Neurospora sp. IMI 360204]|nr:hypothetical protein N0V85_008544 [Neurospora sp. IMI 360204]
MCFTNERKFPIFSLSAEIRVAIYRALWTLPVGFMSEQHFNDDDDKQTEQASHQLALITTFKNLALSCRQIRNELSYEFVTRVLPFIQFHLGSAYRAPTPSLSALNNHQILKELQSSAFLTQNIQHLSLHWGGCSCSEDGSRFQPQIEPEERLRWLTTLPQLKALEVVFPDPFYLPIQQITSASGPVLPGPDVTEVAAEEGAEEEDAEWNDNDSDGGVDELSYFLCSFCWEGLMTLPQTLEKVIFRVWCREDPEDEVHPAAVDETWEVTAWYQRTRVNEEQYARTGIWKRVYVDESEESQEYEVKYHVGAIDVEWPLSERI